MFLRMSRDGEGEGKILCTSQNYFLVASKWISVHCPPLFPGCLRVQSPFNTNPSSSWSWKCPPKMNSGCAPPSICARCQLKCEADMKLRAQMKNVHHATSLELPIFHLCLGSEGQLRERYFMSHLVDDKISLYYAVKISAHIFAIISCLRGHLKVKHHCGSTTTRILNFQKL